MLSIIQYIADDNLAAAQRLKDEIESKVGKLPHHPKLYRAGRVFGTREMIVRANYVIVYAEEGDAITILRVLHAAQLWPPENKKR